MVLTERKVLRQKEMRENGWKDKRYIKIKEYRNRHEGERCFVIVTGPSLTMDGVNNFGWIDTPPNDLFMWFIIISTFMIAFMHNHKVPENNT